MPEDKSTPDATRDRAPAPEGGGDLNAAMQEAVAAVERRERGETGDLPVAPAAGQEAAGAVTEALLGAKRELQEVLEQTRKEAESFRDRWHRAAADLENYRKRAVREREEVVKFGNEKLLRDLLPMADDIERAVAAAEGSSDLSALLEGVRMVHKKFLSQLEKSGATSFESVGEAFDPARHEAVQQQHSEHPPGVVVTQLQRGFLLNDRLLRPAMVVVSLGPETKSEG